ncbi:MAG TPA: hypothetical protein VMP08_17405 [Anaerolineae bacterium]|nr:hypothetical protein [Anaerolineae bacterium]
MNKAKFDPDDSRWQWLYRLGGIAALIVALFIPLQVVIFMAWPPPTTAQGYYTVFQNNPVIGLLNLDLLLIIDQVLGVVILMALYIALRRTSETAMAIALVVGIVVAATYFASNPAFNMLTLSHQYAAAVTDVQRALYLAAGESMLAIYNGTAFHVSYILGALVGTVIGVVMWRSEVFSRATASMAILANVISLGLYVPVVGLYISIFSVLFLEIFYILVARRFWQMGRRESHLVLQPA